MADSPPPGPMPMTSLSTCPTSLMLWNWDTLDLCLISPAWHIRSAPAFAFSCLAVSLLAMCIPLLRRMSREYDRRLVGEHRRRTEPKSGRAFRPRLLQRLARAMLSLSQFAVGYFTMLIFMLLNGYLIFSVLGGVFVGYVVFEGEGVEGGSGRMGEGPECCG
jgi:solute carrier family 31 (copper transporter), member 1